MKRARRDRVLSRLYADLDSGDFDIRDTPMFQLALMLRVPRSAPTSTAFTEDEHLSRGAVARSFVFWRSSAGLWLVLCRLFSRQGSESGNRLVGAG